MSSVSAITTNAEVQMTRDLIQEAKTEEVDKLGGQSSAIVPKKTKATSIYSYFCVKR